MSDTPKLLALMSASRDLNAIDYSKQLEVLVRELERENAALRVALNEFSNLSYVALLAPVPNARPHYALVKKHQALLNNGLKKEAQP